MFTANTTIARITARLASPMTKWLADYISDWMLNIYSRLINIVVKSTSSLFALKQNFFQVYYNCNNQTFL